jgi:hypothetical protein
MKDSTPPLSSALQPPPRPSGKQVCASALLSLSLLLASAPPAHPQTAVTVTVDYSDRLGPSEQMASGFLHGIGATHPAQYLIDGVKVAADRDMVYVSGEAPGVTGSSEPGEYDPNLFDPATYARITDANPNVALMAGLYYYVDASGENYWPGDGGNESTWRGTVADLVDYAYSHDLKIYSWLPWNEPNIQWTGTASPQGTVRNTADYYQAWLNAYQVVKSVNSSARVQGPEAAGFDESYIESFLLFCKANNALPDILSWHDLASGAPEDIESESSEIVAWMSANGIKPMPLAITEYAGGNPVGYNPGQIAAYIARLERASRESGMLFGLNSDWDYGGGSANFIGTLGNQADAATGTYPTGGWWVYNAYKDATGEAVSETSSNTAVVEAFAAYDANISRSEILLGDPIGGSASNVTLTLKNLNDSASLTNGGKIHLRVETIMPAGDLYQPTVALEGDYATSGNALTVTLPTLESQNAYRILVNAAIATAPTTYYEAHLLPETNTAGVVYTTYAESGSRDGTAASLNATAKGDEIAYMIDVATAGVYDLRAGLKRGNSNAMLQLYVNGAAVGGPKDEYESTTNLYNDDFGNVDLPAGNSTLKFVAVNKNPSSSDYAMSFDYFELIALAATTTPTNPIVPYIAVNGVWNPTPETAVTVAVGSTVSLGPWPASGGTWAWTGPNGFTSTAREIDDIPLTAGANVYIATYTLNGVSSTETFTVTATPTNPIVPYIAVNGVWNPTPETAVTVAPGTSVNLGPQPISGKWSWTGPNGFASSAREIDNIALSAGANVYTATYTVNGASYTQAFTVTVSGSCAANPIVPHIALNGVWNPTAENTVTIASTATAVNLGPWPLSGGTWSWTGPKSFTSTAREIDNIPLSVGSNLYTATFVSDGCSYTEPFTVTVQ